MELPCEGDTQTNGIEQRSQQQSHIYDQLKFGKCTTDIPKGKDK